MIEYAKTGEPSVINYNVPEPTAYRGRNIIKLEYDKSLFINPEGEVSSPRIAEPLTDPGKFLDRAEQEAVIRNLKGSKSAGALKNIKLDPLAKEISKPAIQTEIKKGYIPIITNTVNGIPVIKLGKDPKTVDPAIFIVETYKLSNYLGDYGAGRVINTFSLLPGEKTKISVKSYRSSTVTSKESSSIFDSYTTETEDSFEESVQSENSDRELEEETFNYHAEAEAEAKWGWGSAKVSGGVSGSTSSARENFSKNMNSATNKHANKASATRDITVNSSSESTITEGEESVIERVIENINTDRTLNFVFRQMNQQFFSILHLVDIKLCFYNGYEETKMEVALSDVDKLMQYCVKEEKDRVKIKKDILNMLKTIIDYTGTAHSDFVQVKEYAEADGTKNSFWTVNRSKKTVLADINKTVEGIVMLRTDNVLRTDGIIVEALLGQSNAHSEFTETEKTQNVLLKEASCQSVVLQNQLMELFIKSLKDKDNALTTSILSYFETTRPQATEV